MANTSRREFLGQAAVGVGAVSLGGGLCGAEGDRKRPRIAGIYTELRERSHAYHILEAHMGPYVFNGKLTDPGVDVVSWYADQFPDNDMTREAVARLEMPLYETITEALTCGGEELAVDGVLLIGEHGDYPVNDLGQKMYPRKEFFDEIVAVFRKSGRVVPVFNDKHLSYRWDWCKEMYDVSRKMEFPLMAGSSVPLAQRVPAMEVPAGVELEGAVSVHGGPMESYDFHGLEVLQSIVEARRGGEVGVSSVQFLEGDDLLNAGDAGLWSRELYAAAMRAEAEHRDDTPDGPDVGEMQPGHGILLEYADGFRAAVLQAGQSAVRWNFACRVKGGNRPQATTFYPGPWGNRCLFRALSHAIQQMFLTGTPPYPVERTLLVSGILDAAMRSRHEGNVKKRTPDLEFGYDPVDFTAMRETGASWEVITKETPQPEKFVPGDLDTVGEGLETR